MASWSWVWKPGGCSAIMLRVLALYAIDGLLHQEFLASKRCGGFFHLFLRRFGTLRQQEVKQPTR